MTDAIHDPDCPGFVVGTHERQDDGSFLWIGRCVICTFEDRSTIRGRDGFKVARTREEKRQPKEDT